MSDNDSDDINEMGDGHGHDFVDDEAEVSGEENGTDGDDESGWDTEEAFAEPYDGPGWPDSEEDLEEDEDSEEDSESESSGNEEGSEAEARRRRRSRKKLDRILPPHIDRSVLDNPEGMDENEKWEKSARLLQDIAHYADFGEEFDDDDSDMGTDYDFGAYDSSDSWDNNVIETAAGEVRSEPNIKYMTQRLRFFDGREKNPGTRTFPKFNDLPAELRLRIWELYCSEIKRKQRVIQVYVQRAGRLTPAVTMDQQTKPVRRLMSICQETRALGLKALPDILPIGHSRHDKAILRFNAQTDVIHFMDEHPFGLNAVGADESAVTATDPEHVQLDAAILRARANPESLLNKNKKDRDVPEPYLNVRNLAIGDREIRTREPGMYHDRYYGNSMMELISSDDASHRQAHELRGTVFLDSIEYLFPNLETIYVAEDGACRKSDRWAGHIRGYQRYHVRGYEMDEYEGHKETIEYMYCWHAPPRGFKRTPIAIEEKKEDDKKEEEEAKEASEAAETETAKNGESSGTNGETAAEPAANGESATNDESSNNDNTTSAANGATTTTTTTPTTKNFTFPGDFRDEVVINHFASLRSKGVRFSRMLFFENEGMEDYWNLQLHCRPDGKWPKDSDGRPMQDEIPVRIRDGDDMGWQEEDDEDEDEEDEDEDDDMDSMIDDGMVDESASSSDAEEDDLQVVGSSDEDSDNDEEAPPLEGMFSSPEPEPETTSGPSRGKKRRVVDSDDEEDEKDDAENPRASPSKRQRRVVNISSDEEEEEPKAAKKAEKKADSSSSSRTEPGSDDYEDEDDKPEKPLTLMQKLKQGLKTKVGSDEEKDSNDEEEEDGDEDEWEGIDE